ncbi:TIGR00341 family protein [Halomicroarcula sp. GCM10025709]|uniref:TIGR00341 family protein n=1 Tax=Haloarcula TaxID=2237 RepID=UPI0024C312D9|nr:TIGR00341 family protein [Halomicroarcula sp. YJ-61-S]
MRLVKILVDEDDLDAVLSVLDDEDIDHVSFERVTSGAETSEELLVEFPLPNQAVEYVRDRLDETGVTGRYFVAVNAEMAQTEHFDALEDRFITGTEEGDSVSPEELRSTALSLHPDPAAYYVMTVVSTLVAVAGLLLNSAALVVGAMVIAPQVGSALTASVGTTMRDWSMLKRGVRAQVLSLSLAVLASAVFGVALQSLGSVSPVVHLETIAEIGERTSPGLLTLAVGLAAGIAGAVGLATALPVSLVGVMIAAALIPAAAAVGVGIAWNAPSVAIGALVLLVANIVAVNAAGYATLRAFGYKPRDDEGGLPSIRTSAASLVLIALVVATGVTFTLQASFENDVNGAVDGVLDDSEYEDLELIRTQTDFVFVPGSEPPGVAVVVGRPAHQSYPTLAADLGQAISRTTGRDVTVRVEFVERQRYDGR